MSRRELEKLLGAVNQKVIHVCRLPVIGKVIWLNWKLRFVKGKQLHDKRANEKDRDWQRDEQGTSRMLHK